MSRNVVLVTVDSFRADHCGFLGYEGDITSTLDKMAEEGIVFENAISPGPRTPESMPVIFTGEYIPENLPQDMVPQRQQIQNHMQTQESIPERFSRKGYHTIGFTPNPFTSRYFGFDQGFDEFHDFLDSSDNAVYDRLFQGWLGGDTISNILRLARNMALQEEVFKPWESFYDGFLTSINNAPEPYFAWIFLMDVHEPYLAGDGYHSISWWKRWKATWEMYLGDKETPFDETTRERLLTAYDDSIRYTDAFFEQFLADVPGDPLIAMHGDHGEAFGEHGVYSHEPYLYEENIHVPLLLYGNGQDRIHHPVSLRSLPTILQKAISDGTQDYGESIAEARTARDDTTALRTSSLKYIENTSDNELYYLPEGELTQLENTDLQQLCSAVVDRNRERTEEYARISNAVTDAIQDVSEQETPSEI